MNNKNLKKNIKDYALGLLARKDYSRKQFQIKLLSKDYDFEEVEETISYLIEKNIFKEENFIRSIVIKKMNQGYSPTFIQNHLETKGISIPLHEVNFFFFENGINEKIQIENLISKKTQFLNLQGPDEEQQKIRDKILRFLSSRGHSLDTSSCMLESIIPSF